MKTPITLAIVDDEVVFRKKMALLIQPLEGIQLVWAGDTAKGLLAELDRGDLLPDIILMDIKSETGVGGKSAHLFTRKYPGIRLILLSSYFSPAFVMQTLKIGIAAYLPKNAMPAQVDSTIRAVAAKGFCYSEPVKQMIHENLVAKKRSTLPLIGLQVSGREKEVLHLICEQYARTEIAAKLNISTRIVEWHRKNLLKKFNCRNTAGLVALAIQQELIQVDISTFWQPMRDI
jgi:DNA-binding NarL/FixJ family response regulator